MNRIEEYRFSILPQHIAFILDGNGRWAKAKGLIRTMGHEKGIKTLVNIVKEVRNLGIKFMSVFAFSTENWNRPSSEVNYLMTRALDEFKKYEAKLNELDFNLRIIGEVEGLNEELSSFIKKINNHPFIESRFTLFVMFNYSGQLEIVQAAKKLRDNKLAFTKENFERCLYTYPAPMIDYLIRTSGEMRISNFMLYQASYAELYFPKTFWPAFTKNELYKALDVYQKRDRRFGKIEVK